MRRRDFLGASLPLAALAVGGAWPAERALAQDAGKRPPQAREGQIRITDVRTHHVGRLLVQVVTDAGIDGWGEINTVPAPIADAVVQTFKPLLIGTSATAIEQAWQMLYRAHRNLRGGHIHVSAIAGIDIALWDILGKAVNRPVYELLGGPCRDKLRFYPSPTAWKQTTSNLHRMIETPDRLDPLVAALEKRRQDLGRSGWLMIDGHGKFTPQVAAQLCKRVEHLDILFFEEVVPPENNPDLAKVRQASAVPLCVGERMSTIWPFRPVLEAKLADVLNADVVSVGGISQLHKLAHLAEVYDVPIAPHGTHGPIGAAASFHVDAAVTNFLIQEYYGNTEPYITGLTKPAEGSVIDLPSGPGLGVTVNMEGLAEAVARQREKGDKGIDKAYFLDDGSVADR